MHSILNDSNRLVTFRSSLYGLEMYPPNFRCEGSRLFSFTPPCSKQPAHHRLSTCSRLGNVDPRTAYNERRSVLLHVHVHGHSLEMPGASRPVGKAKVPKLKVSASNELRGVKCNIM